MFQLSLRSLLVLVAFVALAIVSLRFASPGWRTVVVWLAVVAFWIALIVAIIDRGPQRAFAIGCIATVLFYIAVLAGSGFVDFGSNDFDEFNPDTGWLPTTLVLRQFYRVVSEIRYVDFSGDVPKVIENFDPTKVAGPGSQNYSMQETPSRRMFMVIGHTWWAILFGLCGGWLAQWVYVRRTRGQPPLASGRS